MTMRIAVVMASSGVDEAALEERRQYLQAVVAAGTEISMLPNPAAPASIQSVAELDQAAVQVAAQVVQVGKSGYYDAAVIWCGDDPGLLGAREVATMPVVGPLSASISVAQQVGDRFAIVTSQGSSAIARRYVWSRGLGQQLVDVHEVPIPVLEIRSDLRGSIGTIATAVVAAREKGADSVILGCMAMFGLASGLTQMTGVPVIDAGEAAVLAAQSLVAMGLSNASSAPDHQRYRAPEHEGETE
jgi:allantoin racemase